MTINDFFDEYEGLTDDRKTEGLYRLFTYLQDHKDTNEGVIYSLLEVCSEEERNDGFGTEGLDI